MIRYLTFRAGCLLAVAIALAASTKAAAQTNDGSLQAGQDAYQMGEQQRRAAIDRQRELGEQLRDQNTWAQPNYVAPPGGYAYGYVPYPYGVYNPRRAYRRVSSRCQRQHDSCGYL